MSVSNAFSNYLSWYLISCHIKPAPWIIVVFFCFVLNHREADLSLKGCHGNADLRPNSSDPKHGSSHLITAYEELLIRFSLSFLKHLLGASTWAWPSTTPSFKLSHQSSK